MQEFIKLKEAEKIISKSALDLDQTVKTKYELSKLEKLRILNGPVMTIRKQFLEIEHLKIIIDKNNSLLENINNFVLGNTAGDLKVFMGLKQGEIRELLEINKTVI